MAASIKVARTLVLTNGLTLKVVSGHPAGGMQTEEINVSDMSNQTRVEKLLRPQLELTDLNFLCEYAGTLATVGGTSAVTLVITVDGADGTDYADTITGFVKSAQPQEVAVDGERRLLQAVVFTPDGSEGSTTTSV